MNEYLVTTATQEIEHQARLLSSEITQRRIDKSVIIDDLARKLGKIYTTAEIFFPGISVPVDKVTQP
ncbi:MAG: hypothetical protein AABW64_04820 [Nanoarchaeota archaeon]